MPHAARRLLAAILVASLLPAGCVPVRPRTPAPAPARPPESYRLRALLPLDTRGGTVAHGRVAGVGDETTGGRWRGAVILAWPAYVDGTLSEVQVRAEVDTGTAVTGTGDVRDRLLDLSGADVRVALRREAGSVLRVESLAAVASLPEPVSVDGVLGAVPGGRAMLRGLAGVDGVGASAGTLRMKAVRDVYGIEVTLYIPVRWDASTVLVSPSAERRPLGAALRARPDMLLGAGTEVRYRRTPDGLVAEEVVPRP